MANFIKYENLDFSLNSQTFWADKLSISAEAQVEPAALSDGTLNYYAPQGAVIGSLSSEFYLTGSLPSFLNVTGYDESAVTGSFGGVSINSMYLKSIDFSFDPFSPILVKADFDWFGQISIYNISEQNKASRNAKIAPTYISHAYKSYVDPGTLDAGTMVAASYSAQCKRIPFFHVDSKVPFRVAKAEKSARLDITSNKLSYLVDINGYSAATNIYIKDFYGTQLGSFGVSGIIDSQSYSVSNGNKLMSKISIYQQVTRAKTLI